jgi:hypothetical protein
MEGKLIKMVEGYTLSLTGSIDDLYGISNEQLAEDHKLQKLSIKNCDEIFGTFNVEDIKKSVNTGLYLGSTISNTLISIATEHPPGIWVRITMSCSLPNGCTEPGIECTCDPIPALDENGCLILWVLKI